jgi:hypothetical protein
VPARPSSKGRLKKRRKAFGSGEGRAMRSAARSEVGQGPAEFVQNFELTLGGRGLVKF